MSRALPRGKPPANYVELAERAIPNIFANVDPSQGGSIELIELVASHLTKRLQDGGHTLAAAQWAIRESVRAGRLRPGLIQVDLPSVVKIRRHYKWLSSSNRIFRISPT